ncbi:fibronectin type III domain-containing protein [Actinokineospora sp. PR83]|uniref:fibronectin type III domain-containing protein n=1 Tax=Actinokineospora sp. PR83 TaxID=2884908 RepID=UPI0027DFDE6B|nr:fibronectin type III domain-containing protein [Actinokineospora sp. PR83]MCG8918539.1 fibronectin type III domain-containing protein [Actinokineospora sp. PR83]
MRTRTRTLLTAVTVIAGVLGAPGQAAAAPAGVATGPQVIFAPQSCPFPLLVTQAVQVEGLVDLPSTAPVGQPTPATRAQFTVTFPAEVRQGLSLVGAETLDGTITVPLTGTYSDGRVISTEHEIPLTRVPVSGPPGPIQVVDGVPIPPVTEAAPTVLTWRVGGLRAFLTPKRADGTPTGLGSFNTGCTVPERARTGAARVSFGGATQPAGAVTAQECPMPLIGNQTSGVRATTSLPAQLPTGASTPAADLDLAITFPPLFTTGLALVEATRVRGTLRLPVTVVADGVVRSRTEYRFALPDTPVPAEGSALTLGGRVRLAPETGTTAGVLDWYTGDLTMELTPLNGREQETGLGTFTSTCTLRSGQDAHLASVRFADAEVPGIVQDCVFPLIGSQPQEVRARVDLPAELPVGSSTPASTATTSFRLTEATVQGLHLIGAARLRGELRLPITRSFEGAPAGARTYVQPVDVAVPQGTDLLDVPGTAVLDPATSAVPGVLSWSVGDVGATLTAVKADGSMSEVFDFRCTTRPGQDTRFASVRFTPVLTAPTGLTAQGTTSDSVRLTWSAATGPAPITGYEVHRDGTGVAETTATEAVVSGLSPATGYSFTVRAVDATGAVSAPSAALVVRTPPSPPTRFAFTTAGSSRLEEARTTIALSGTATGELLPSGEVTGDVTFAPTTVRLGYAGIPITATAQFAPTGQVTGTLSGGTLTAGVDADFRLRSIRLFGLPVPQTGTCGTATPAHIDLSGTGITPARGGVVTGAYPLAGFSGCGALTPWLTNTVSGPGNTLSLTLTPGS